MVVQVFESRYRVIDYSARERGWTAERRPCARRRSGAVVPGEGEEVWGHRECFLFCAQW